MRRGFIFTMDAVLALLLVLVLITSLTSIVTDSNRVYVTPLQAQNKELAQNILETLRTVPLSNLVPPTQIEVWIEDGILNLTYVTPQMPPLKIVATYWALSPKYPEFKTYAEEILGYLLKNLAKGYKYQLIINNYTSPYLTFDNSYQNASDVGSATVLVSGYIANQSPRGYVAKAYLTKLVTTQEKLVGIQRVLAGGYYCTYLGPSSYNDYPLTVSSISIEYQTVPGDENEVQSGSFKLSGNYGNTYVNISEDLAGWDVAYYINRGGYVTSIVLSKGNKSLVLYTSYASGYNPETYSVYRIDYTDENGNTIVVYLNSGVYVTINWVWDRGWYISSSRAYTTTPEVSDAYYRVVVYSCQYYNFNAFNVTFSVVLPDDANVTEGLWNAARRGEDETMDVYINGYQLSNPYSSDVTDIFKGGSNIIKAEFSSTGDTEIGFGSGSWISLKYKTSTPQVDNPGLVKLYNITSEGTGIYYLNSLFVPGNITGINIKLTIEGVHEVRIYYSNGTSLDLIYENTSVSPNLTTIFISNSTLVGNLTNKYHVSLSELSRRSFNLVIMLDAYYNSSYSRPVRYAGQDYHYDWNNERILYGYPYSYINITYTDKITRTRFMIPVEQTYLLNGENPVYWGNYFAGYRTMYFDYYLPSKAIPWYVDVWTAIHFLGYPEGTTTLYEGPNANITVFEFPLDYYLIRLAYTRLNPSIMVPGATNEFKLESSSNDYVFRVSDSRAIVYYFLNGYAPYGKIFPYYAQDNACGYNLTYYYNISGTPQRGTVVIGNCNPSEEPINLNASELQPWKYALDNAVYRLFVQLGAKEYPTTQLELNSNLLPGARDNPIMIELKGLSIEAIGVRNVPSSISPIQVTLRIWRGS
ncbi:hypothetical protein [Thermococcus sp.]|uniref:hypothetical protein n=1 Tax=Thermococcus sp. TaxID=35749 RepID=UPI0026283045|nr:hypothetical protein [Thermococcus sp.]